jgi:hypothetical protein
MCRCEAGGRAGVFLLAKEVFMAISVVSPVFLLEEPAIKAILESQPQQQPPQHRLGTVVRLSPGVIFLPSGEVVARSK